MPREAAWIVRILRILRAGSMSAAARADGVRVCQAWYPDVESLRTRAIVRMECMAWFALVNR